jgi:glutamate mutase epsilon subunit
MLRYNKNKSSLFTEDIKYKSGMVDHSRFQMKIEKISNTNKISE